MSQYIGEKYSKEGLENYSRFYWTTSQDIKREIYSGKDISFQKEAEEYNKILATSKLRIFNEPNFDISQHFNMDTDNTFEIDNYLMNLNQRSGGNARKITFEVIKRAINSYFTSADNNEMYLCSTLHKDNFSSKYVSEFFGLKDSLFVERRQGRNREVHVLKLNRMKHKHI